MIETTVWERPRCICRNDYYSNLGPIQEREVEERLSRRNFFLVDEKTNFSLSRQKC